MSHPLAAYFQNIADTVKTVPASMGIVLKNFVRKPVTIQYPDEKEVLPPRSRMQLFNDVDDCIACNQCARVCPVSCIAIESVKEPGGGSLGETTDGHVKRLHLLRFDIDMAKCCYCNLCTIPCPTECLVMTPNFEESVRRRSGLIYHFGRYTPEEGEALQDELAKREEELKAKKAAKAAEAGAAKPAPAAASEAGPAKPAAAATAVAPAGDGPAVEILGDQASTIERAAEAAKKRAQAAGLDERVEVAKAKSAAVKAFKAAQAGGAPAAKAAPPAKEAPAPKAAAPTPATVAPAAKPLAPTPAPSAGGDADVEILGDQASTIARAAEKAEKRAAALGLDVRVEVAKAKSAAIKAFRAKNPK